MIISDIYFGWCNVRIGDFNCVASYTRPVPIDILEGILDYYTHGICVIPFDSENYVNFLIIDSCSGCLGVKETQAMSINNPPEDIIIQLYKEISERKDEWLDWLSGDERERQYYKNFIDFLEEKIYEAERNN